jgi:hypothetical protein
MRDAIEDQRRLQRAAREFLQGSGEGESGVGSFAQRLGRLLREASRPPPRSLLDPELAVPSSTTDANSSLDAQVEAAEMERRRQVRAEKQARRRAAASSPTALLLGVLAAAALAAQWWPLVEPVAAYVRQAGVLDAWPVLKATLWTYPETPATALMQYTVVLGGGGGGGAATAAAASASGWWRPLTSGLLGSGLLGGALVARGLARAAWWIDASAPYGGGAGAVIGAYALSCLGACVAGGGLLRLMAAAVAAAGATTATMTTTTTTAALLAGPGAVVGMHVAWLLLALRVRRAWQRERSRAGPSAARDGGGGGAVEATMAEAAAAARVRKEKNAGDADADAKAKEEGKRLFELVEAIQHERAPPLGQLPESLLPPLATATGAATVIALAALSLAQPAANAASLIGGALGGAAAAALSDQLSAIVGAALRAPLFLALATLRVGARVALSAAGVVLAFVIATARGVRAAARTIRGGV